MSFRLRLFISISLLIAVTYGIGGAVLISASFQSSLKKETATALESYETVQNTLYLINSLGEKTDYIGLADALTQMAEQDVCHWQALSLKSEERTIYLSGNEKLFSADLPVPKTKQCVYTNVVDAYGHGLQVLCIISAGEEQLFLEARFDLSSVYEARRMQQHLFLVIYSVVVLLGIFIATALSFALTGRLRKLTGAVRQISEGDLSKRSGISAEDEFGQLSRNFDTMVDKLQENIDKLESAMEQQEAFMGAFAHELKTPMTSIIGYADLLRQGDLDENTRMIAADYIFSEGKRLEKLSFKLLELLMLKKDAFSLQEVSLPMFLQEIEKALSSVLKEKEIQFICKSDGGKVFLEPDLVKSLLYNLVDNAVKAMDGAGMITIQISSVPGGCKIQVIDTGRGMESSELSKITEAFYRVDKSRSRKQGGAGLGLALCKEIVDLHNGRLEFDSVPGKGTRAVVTLYGKGGAENE